MKSSGFSVMVIPQEKSFFSLSLFPLEITFHSPFPRSQVHNTFPNATGFHQTKPQVTILQCQVRVTGGSLPLCFAGMSYMKEMFALHFCEQSAVATWMPVTGFHYGKHAKERHGLQNPLNCFLLLYIFFYDKNSLILEFKKPLPKGKQMVIKKIITKRGIIKK